MGAFGPARPVRRVRQRPRRSVPQHFRGRHGALRTTRRGLPVREWTQIDHGGGEPERRPHLRAGRRCPGDRTRAVGEHRRVHLVQRGGVRPAAQVGAGCARGRPGPPSAEKSRRVQAPAPQVSRPCPPEAPAVPRSSPRTCTVPAAGPRITRAARGSRSGRLAHLVHRGEQRGHDDLLLGAALGGERAPRTPAADSQRGRETVHRVGGHPDERSLMQRAGQHGRRVPRRAAPPRPRSSPGRVACRMRSLPDRSLERLTRHEAGFARQTSTAAAWPSPTSRKSRAARAKRPGGLAAAACDSTQDRRLRPSSAAARLELAHVRREAAKSAPKHVGWIADHQVEAHRRAHPRAGRPERTHRVLQPERPRRCARPPPAPPHCCRWPVPRTPASWARLRAMAPLPVPTSATSGLRRGATPARRAGPLAPAQSASNRGRSAQQAQRGSRLAPRSQAAG